MDTPTKERVRDYLRDRFVTPSTPTPSLEEIRRQLGWDLVQQAREAAERVERRK